MNYQKKYNELVLDLHSNDFEDSESKLNLFVENNSGILQESDFARKISMLRAQGYEYASQWEEALSVYLQLWNQYFSVDDFTYSSIGLTIIRLYLKLNKEEEAISFTQKVFNEISAHGFENHDLILSINLFRMLPKFDTDIPSTKQFLNYLEEQIGVTFDSTIERSKLEELENKLRSEGQQLTKILATAHDSTLETTIRDLEEFLKIALNPAFRSQASFSIENLRKSNAAQD